MTIHARDGGVWRECVPYARVAGTWREVLEGYVKVAGVWRPFYLAEAQFTVTVGNQLVSPITYYGYCAGDPPLSGATSFGSRSPSTAFGETITGAYWIGGGSLLNLALADAGLGSSFLASIEVVGVGSDSSLSYDNSSGDSVWQADVGSVLPLGSTATIILRRT